MTCGGSGYGGNSDLPVCYLPVVILIGWFLFSLVDIYSHISILIGWYLFSLVNIYSYWLISILIGWYLFSLVGIDIEIRLCDIWLYISNTQDVLRVLVVVVTVGYSILPVGYLFVIYYHWRMIIMDLQDHSYKFSHDYYVWHFLEIHSKVIFHIKVIAKFRVEWFTKCYYKKITGNFIENFTRMTIGLQLHRR